MSDSHKPVTPTDVIADGIDGGEFRGTPVRKGTIKAVIDNINALDGLSPDGEEYRALVAQIRELKPALVALGLLDVFEPRDPAIAKILAS